MFGLLDIVWLVSIFWFGDIDGFLNIVLLGCHCPVQLTLFGLVSMVWFRYNCLVRVALLGLVRIVSFRFCFVWLALFSLVGIV